MKTELTHSFRKDYPSARSLFAEPKFNTWKSKTERVAEQIELGASVNYTCPKEVVVAIRRNNQMNATQVNIVITE